jgi:uncharacterized protein YsxB (DUF464 family)
MKLYEVIEMINEFLENNREIYINYNWEVYDEFDGRHEELVIKLFYAFISQVTIICFKYPSFINFILYS